MTRSSGYRLIVISTLFAYHLLDTSSFRGQTIGRSVSESPWSGPVSQALYILFQRGSDGTVRPQSYAAVDLSTPLSPIDLDSDPWGLAPSMDRNCEKVEVQLQAPKGELIYRNLVCTPRWVRAEFHGEDGGEIEGRIFPQTNPTFVVRVPYLAEGTLTLLDSPSSVLASFPLRQLIDDTPLIDLAEHQSTSSSTSDAGDPTNRVDLLIMGDGYTPAESAQFASDAASAQADFFGISPYGEYQNYFNLHTLFTPSAQSGADHPPYDPSCSIYDLSCCSDSLMTSDPLAGTFVNTAFDASYCYYGLHRLMYVDLAAVYSAASAVPDWDVILVLVNDGTYGGAGGSVMVASTHAFSAEIAQHEFGHAFVDLADEYESPYPGYPSCSDLTSPPCEVNVTDVTTRAQIKWSPWIDPLTPIPTEPENDPAYAGVVGLFEGARYLSTNMYRSGQSCIMRSLGAPYCQVPSQAFVLRLYNGGWGDPWGGISMIEPGSPSPASASVTLTHPATAAFQVGLLQPVGGPPAEVKWYVDNVERLGETGDTFQFSTDPALPDPVEIRVEVRDLTPLVHPAMAGTSLEFSHTWTVSTDYALYLPLIAR